MNVFLKSDTFKMMNMNSPQTSPVIWNRSHEVKGAYCI